MESSTPPLAASGCPGTRDLNFAASRAPVSKVLCILNVAIAVLAPPKRHATGMWRSATMLGVGPQNAPLVGSNTVAIGEESRFNHRDRWGRHR